MTYEYITQYNSPNYTPNSKVKSVYGRLRTIDSITVHWWGDPNQKPQFSGIISHLCRPNGNSSAHEVIEAGRVAPIVNHTDAAWHSGNSVGNATSIGLELNPRCSDGDYATAAERIADIWKFYNKILPLIPHKKWKATQCPGNYDLNRLHAEALAFYNGKPTPPPTPAPTNPWGRPLLVEDGKNGSATILEQQYIFGTDADGTISEVSQLTWAIQEWLNARGYKGANGHALVVDGKGYWSNVFDPKTANGVKTNTAFAVQRYLASTGEGRAAGLVPDGTWANPSASIKVLQALANKGRLFV